MAALIQALRDPRCYPHPVDSVRVMETHISWVLLTGSWAYKIKKPIALDFLDFSTIERRLHYCQEELRLNRRFAPQIYHGVVPIGGDASEPRIEGAGEPIEYALKMREFAQEQLFDRRLDAGALTAADIDALGDACARLHAQAPAAAPHTSFGSPQSLLGPALDNFATLNRLGAGGAAGATIAGLRSWTEAEHARLATTFAARKAGGRVRECHGDLHLANIARIDGKPVPFDCIEFDEALRWIDVVDEIAFAVMDLHARGRPDFGQRLLNRYLQAGGDYDGVKVLSFYLVYRALVRAKIDAVRAAQESGAAAAARFGEVARKIELARRFAHGGRRFLAITCGVSGSGKTYATGRALEHTRAIRVRSDVERKRLAGMEAQARSGSTLDSGLYGAQASERTFARLAELARTIIEAGFPAIVDATFIERGRRRTFRELAGALGVPFVVLHCHAPDPVLCERILRRQQAAADASEADIGVLRAQQQRQHPLAPSECDEVIEVDSEDAASIDAMVQRLAALEHGA